VVLDASQSSQFVSGLLLSAPRFEQGVTVRHAGGRLPSAPHLAMTVEALRASGAEVDDSEPGTWVVAPGPLVPRDAVVEPDLSTAAAYLAAPLVAGGSVTVSGWPRSTTQPGAVLPELLAAMGGRVERTDHSVTVSAGDGLHGIEADLSEVSELTTVLAALAALADGPSRFTGVAHIRLHETDRLAALATELNALGGDVRELPDGVEVRPRRLTGGVMRQLRRPPGRHGLGRARAGRRGRAGPGQSPRPARRSRTSSAPGRGCCPGHDAVGRMRRS
jgi:3-phosphoshikimate 1-carboxyvinyltransferase